jgi:hypothetical protein
LVSTKLTGFMIALTFSILPGRVQVASDVKVDHF